MSHYFLDSSALIKRYIVELGTSWIRSIATPNAGSVIFISRITPVEVVSGAMRRHWDGSITVRTSLGIRLLVDGHAESECRVVGLVKEIFQRAENLLERYPLRVYDSIQLASALESNTRLAAAGLPAIIFSVG